MSFITDIVKYGLGQFGIESRSSNPRAVSISAVTSILDRKVTETVKKSNSVSSSSVGQSTVNSPQPIEDAVKQLEVQVKVDMQASTNASVPVVYGTGVVEGVLVDAAITNNNCTMWYAIAICEVTGPDLNNNPSIITIDNVFWDGQRVIFAAGGGGADSPQVQAIANGSGRTGINEVFVRDTVVDDRFSRGLFNDSRVRIYLYGNARLRTNPATVNGGSEAPVGTRSYPTSNTQFAYNLMPGWTPDHKMSNLIFALVRIDFDPERDVTKLGKLTFKVTNSLTNPADVINDYMTNPVYGAGIPDEDIDK
jgi:hypothetical protein